MIESTNQDKLNHHIVALIAQQREKQETTPPTPAELSAAAEALARLPLGMVPEHLFYARIWAFPAICSDAALLRKTDGGVEVFLTYRKDYFFDGFHIPGSILIAGDTLESRLAKVVAGEIGLAVQLSRIPGCIAQAEILPGNTETTCPRGQVLAHLFGFWYEGGELPSKGRWFPVVDTIGYAKANNLPLIPGQQDEYAALAAFVSPLSS